MPDYRVFFVISHSFLKNNLLQNVKFPYGL